MSNYNISPKASSSNKLYDVAFIRSVAVILVVFFHAYCMMYTSAHFPNSYQSYRDIYYNLNSICLWFHMPLFVFISGYLFSYLYIEKGKYTQFFGKKGLLLNKTHRLLVPYVIFSLFFASTTNSLSLAGIFSGGYSHLWFLTMLFWCFMLGYILIKKKSIALTPSACMLLLFIFFMLMLFPYCPPRLFGIHNLFRWFFWFWLGCSVFHFRHTLFSAFRRFKALFTFPTLYLIFMYLQIRTVGDYDRNVIRYCAEIGFVFAVLWIWFTVNVCLKRYGTAWAQLRIIQEIGSCSFGIYIFHNWLEPFMISRTAQSIFPLAEWARDHVILFPLCFSLAALICSYVLTKLCLMTKVGRMLLG